MGTTEMKDENKEEEEMKKAQQEQQRKQQLRIQQMESAINQKVSVTFSMIENKSDDQQHGEQQQPANIDNPVILYWVVNDERKGFSLFPLQTFISSSSDVQQPTEESLREQSYAGHIFVAAQKKKCRY